MADFPGQGEVSRSVINPFMLDQPIGSLVWVVGGTAAATAVWPAANRAIYVPFLVYEPYIATQMAFVVGVASGNMDVGIYDQGFNRLVSKGSTAVPAAGVGLFDITDTLLLPGLYFAGVCVDNVTATFQRSNNYNAEYQRIVGVMQQAVGAVTLPATATPAVTANAYIPLITITNATVY